MSGYFRYVKENYIMAFQDVRGRYMSEGEFEDIRPFIHDKMNNNVKILISEKPFTGFITTGKILRILRWMC